MAVAYGQTAQAGDGQSSETNSLVINIPGAAGATDVAVLWVECNSNPSLSTPSGWTLRSGPDAVGTNSTGWCFTRTLIAGDSGDPVTLSFSGTTRCVASMLTFTGGTETGLLIDVVTETSATNSPTLPSIASVPANSMLAASFNRRRTGIPGNTTVPGGYTQPGGISPGTNYATGVNVFADSGYRLITTGGTYGGESGSTGVTAIGNNYLVVIPPASVSATESGPLSGSGTLSVGTLRTTYSGALSGSGTLTVTTSYSMTRSAALTGSGTLSGAATPLADRSVGLTGSGTLSVTAGQLQTDNVNLSGSGTLSATATVTLDAPVNVSGSGTLTATEGNTLGALSDGDGVLSAETQRLLEVSGEATGTGTLSATVLVGYSVDADLSGEASVGAPVIYELGLGGENTLDVTVHLLLSTGASGSGTLVARDGAHQESDGLATGVGVLTAALARVVVIHGQRSRTIKTSTRYRVLVGRVEED
jgi:hypothetical protein